MIELDLNLLTALEALLAEGSVAGAARRLRLSPSAMSRTLGRLRDATGDPLLVRAGRDMVLTPHAQELGGRVGELAAAARAVLRPAAQRLDPTTLKRSFTIRANDGFVEAFAAPLIAAALAEAPGVRLRFAPKPDKAVAPLREGQIDLEIGVIGETGPELRAQGLFRDHFVGVARQGHPLFARAITAERYARCAHVLASRGGRTGGPVDDALAALGLARTVAAVVPSFPAAIAVVGASDLVTQVPHSFFSATHGRQRTRRLVRSFPLPIPTREFTVSQIWHPRLDVDAGHRWLRKLIMATSRRLVRR